MYKIPKEPNKLSFGIYSKSQLNLTYLFTFIFFGGIVLNLFIFSKYIDLIFQIIIYVVILVLYIVAIVKTSVLGRVLKNYFKTNDFNKFCNDIEKLKKDYLHSYSLAVLDLLVVNYLFYIDTNKAYSKFEEITKPQGGLALSIYLQIEVLYYQFKNDKENVEKSIAEFRNIFYQYKNILNILETSYYVYFTKDKIEYVESVFSIKVKKIPVSIINANILFDYYLSRNDIDSCKFLKDFIKTRNKDFNLIADKIDNFQA